MKHCYLLTLFLFATFILTAQENDRPIKLKSGLLTRGKNIKNETLLKESLPRILYKNKLYTLLQFTKLPGLTEKQALNREGIVLFDYLPDNTFLAEMPDKIIPGSLKKYNISGLYAFNPAEKIAGKLLQQLTQTTPGPDQYIAVSFFGTITKAEAEKELKLAGAQIANTKIQPAKVIFIKASVQVLKKIAAIPFVSYLSSQYLKDIPLNYQNQGAHAIHALNATAGRNLQGKNVTIGVGDNADPSTHVDFSGRLINRSPLPANSHGTTTTGTAAGAGIVNPKLKGMAPKSTIISQYYSDILVNTPYYVNDFSMVLTNNSYYSGESGCPGEGEYDVLSNYADDQLVNDPELLHVFSSGNDGAITCTPFPAFFGTVKSGFQVGKNVLTVGSLDYINYIISGFSSRGPVNDGRLKPEIIAGGSGINSTFPNNTYSASWGTSMSAPTVTGTLALLYERYRQLHAGANPQASLIKAAICNGAEDMGNPGPDYTHGFGTMNARSAVEIIENNTYQENTVTQAGVQNFTITGVPAGTDQVKILLYWPDAPAAPFSPGALVNNLDLTVTAPGAVVHFPLILNSNPGNVNDAAVEGVDNINNIEQIVIYNPPAGDFTVTVTGTNVPTGSQNYVVVYQIINPSVTVEYPSGGETWSPGETEFIHWSAYGGSGNTFTVEYSIDNGSNWITLSNTVPSTSRIYQWGPVPNTPSNNTLVRVTRNVAGYTDMSDFNFTILGRPTLTVTNPCRGYAQLSWTTVTTATGYEILMLRGDSMQPIATTAATSYLLAGLSKDTTYWLAVRAISGTTPGRYLQARSVTPGAGPCAAPTYNHDFTPDSIPAPVSGRMFTSSQLGIAAPQVRIRNLGAVASAGSYNISYQVNGGSIVTESNPTVIPAASNYTYTFTQTYNFSATGTYTIRVWVDYGSDTRHLNDTFTTVIKQLQNDPIVLNPTFIEGFEGAASQTYNNSTMGFDGVDRCDFIAGSTNDRARTFINTGIARTGNRAVTLDQKMYSLTSSADSLITTFNLSGYSSADQLWLDFYYRNSGIDFSLPGNQVWIRGSEADAWIPVFVLPSNDPNDFGIYKAATPVNITEALANAVPVQTVSSGFQVKFGEEGFTSTNSVILTSNVDDGFTFDDVMLTRAQNDIGIQAVINPNLTSICTLTNAEVIQVQVKNYSNATVNNVAVSYDFNGTIVTENIPSINAGQVIVYPFAQTADLSALQQYTMRAWINYPTDNYVNNDSLLNIVFNTTPVITSFPYHEGFESNDGYWYTTGINSTWQWGTPANTIINKAANGSSAWVTDLTGNYAISESSYLNSPCFDLSSLSQPVLSFSHIFRMEDDCDCDFHWVEYSLDDVNWIKLGANGSGTNWYDNAVFQVWQTSNTRWHVSSYDIPTTASHVRFRIVVYSDAGVTYEGVGIDDVHVFDKAAIYNGPNITGGLTQVVSGNNWIHFNSGGNRVVSVNANGQNLGSTDVKVYIHPGSVRTSTNQYYLNRNIVIQTAIPPTSPVSVRYYFLESEAVDLINAAGCGGCHTITDAYEAGVTQYSNAPAEENGTLSDNDNGVYNFITPALVNVVPYDNGYYAEYQVSNFSEFWINSGGPGQNQGLPLVLESFTVTKNNNTGLLQWNTLQETNIDKFIIERSGSGINYTAIGQVKAVGNSTGTQQYQFTDNALLPGINYYRLKMIDMSGLHGFSPVRKINSGDNDFTITLYPNPVNQGVLYINTSANMDRLELRDVSGRMIKSVKAQGTQHILPVNNIAKGTYLLSIITSNGKRVEKIFIE